MTEGDIADVVLTRFGDQAVDFSFQTVFDPKDALQTTIELFWEKGYYDGSVDEVVKRSGVAKYGIYGTFGAKRDLFEKALTQYAADRHQDIQRPIRKPDASLLEINSRLL